MFRLKPGEFVLSKGDKLDAMNNQQGFLLIEVLVATVIIAVAVTTAAGLVIRSVKGSSSAAKYTVAASLAQRQVEYLKGSRTAADWAELKIPDTGEVELGSAWLCEENRTIVLNHTTYSLTSLASTCPEDSADLVQVRVVVAWGGKAGESIDITTFFSRY